MHRLRPSLCWQAHRISPLAARLLPVCRTIPSCLAELYWIRQHIRQHPTCEPPRTRLRRMCDARAAGRPLQQVLGEQPFGSVHIRCEPGVLVPRNDTETWAVELGVRLAARLTSERARYAAHDAKLAALEDDDTGLVRRYSGPVAHAHRSPRAEAERLERVREFYRAGRERVYIADFCTGSGCIALELMSSLRAATMQHGRPPFTIWGVDVDTAAVKLARTNKALNANALGLQSAQAPGIADLEKMRVPPNIRRQAKKTGNDKPILDWLRSKGKLFRHGLAKNGLFNGQNTLIMSGVSFSAGDLFSPEYDFKPFFPAEPPANASPDEFKEWYLRKLKYKDSLNPQMIPRIDVMVANPPYLSERAYQHDVERSVRHWEPRLALVPSAYFDESTSESSPDTPAAAASAPGSAAPAFPPKDQIPITGKTRSNKAALVKAHFALQKWLRDSGARDWLRDLAASSRCGADEVLADVFHARLLEIACAARPKVIALEVSGDAQARRVLRMLRMRFDALLWSEDLDGMRYPTEIEIWRDNLHDGAGGGESQHINNNNNNNDKNDMLPHETLPRLPREVGSGQARALFINLPGEWAKRFQQLTQKISRWETGRRTALEERAIKQVERLAKQAGGRAALTKKMPS